MMKVAVHQPLQYRMGCLHGFVSDVDVDIESDDGGLLGLVPDCWPPGPVRIAVVLPDSQAAKHQFLTKH